MKSFNLPSLPVKSNLVVAVSGGPDSVCLLDLLVRAQQYKLVVAHLNHGLRGKSADQDEAFVKKLALKYKLAFVSQKIAVAQYAKQYKLNLEAAARERRYAFLEQVREEHKAQYIVTGHTSDDQLETILLNFLRGSGLEGLSGMEILTNRIWRPLLNVSKSEILQYLKQRHLSFRQDHTNRDPHFNRNRLRLKIVPELDKLNPGFAQVLLRNAQLYREFSKFLRARAAHFLRTHFKQDSFPLSPFQKLATLVQFEVIRILVERYQGNLENLSFSRIGQACKLLQQGQHGKRFKLSPQLTFTLNYARVDCAAGASVLTPSLALCSFKVPGNQTFLGYKLQSSLVRQLRRSQTNEVYLDFKKTGSLFIRNFKAGDRFQPAGMQGHRKLQDFFTDQKVPQALRRKIPLLVTKQGEIVWIAGYRASEKFKATNLSSQILKIKLKNVQ